MCHPASPRTTLHTHSRPPFTPQRSDPISQPLSGDCYRPSRGSPSRCEQDPPAPMALSYMTPLLSASLGLSLLQLCLLMFIVLSTRWTSPQPPHGISAPRTVLGPPPNTHAHTFHGWSLLSSPAQGSHPPAEVATPAPRLPSSPLLFHFGYEHCSNPKYFLTLCNVMCSL